MSQVVRYIGGDCCPLPYSEQEGGEGEGLTMSPTPNFTYLDDLGRSTEGSQDTCLTLTQQIKAAMTEVHVHVGVTDHCNV